MDQSSCQYLWNRQWNFYLVAFKKLYEILCFNSNCFAFYNLFNS